MNKKLLAVAVASAIALPVAAHADTSNVTISGYLNMSVSSLKGKSAPTATDNSSMTNVSSNASNIVLAGKEDLGNGYAAIWQVQTFISFGGTGNTDTVNTDGLSNGTSYVGMATPFGALVAGKSDTPMKTLSRKVDLFNNELGDSRGALDSYSNWDLRTNNAVAYISPNFGGLTVTAAYVTNCTSCGVPVGTDGFTAANSVNDLSAYSLNALYSNGPIFAGVAYENHNFKGASVGATSNPDAWRLAGGYDFGMFKVVALWQRQSNIGGGTKSANTWGLGGSFNATPDNVLKAQYYRANDESGVSNSGGAVWALGYDHLMSKRTTLYVNYAQAQTHAATVGITPFGGGFGDNPGIVEGQSAHGFGVGMIHTF
ncbi:MAG: porin [Betaproteobacteria bacterium]|nr:porin [Betaproteobacteria bacterium]